MSGNDWMSEYVAWVKDEQKRSFAQQLEATTIELSVKIVLSWCPPWWRPLKRRRFMKRLPETLGLFTTQPTGTHWGDVVINRHDIEWSEEWS